MKRPAFYEWILKCSLELYPTHLCVFTLIFFYKTQPSKNKNKYVTNSDIT